MVKAPPNGSGIQKTMNLAPKDFEMVMVAEMNYGPFVVMDVVVLQSVMETVMAQDID